MKKRYSFLLLPLGFILMSFHPYEPSMTLKEKGLKGSVKKLVHQVQNWGNSSIVVEEFNKNGQLTEIRYFEFDWKKSLDTTTIKRDSIHIHYHFVKTDTTLSNYKFLYKIYFQYDTSNRLINNSHFDENQRLLSETKYSYNNIDSLSEIYFIRYDTLGKIDYMDADLYKYFVGKNKCKKVHMFKFEYDEISMS